MIVEKLKKGGTFCQYTKEGPCVSKRKYSRKVLTISIKYEREMVDTTSRIKKMRLQLVVQFNKFMGSID